MFTMIIISMIIVICVSGGARGGGRGGGCGELMQVSAELNILAYNKTMFKQNEETENRSPQN